MPDLPLLLISSYSDITCFVDRINKLSRSRIAEVQWTPSYRGYVNIDRFAECKDPESYLASYPLRRVALIYHPQNQNYLGFISPLLDSAERFLWVSQFDSATADLLDYFLKGHLSPEAIRAQNYAMFVTWLQKHHGVFTRRYQYECTSHEARKQQDDRSVSKWLTKTGYTDEIYKTFGGHLQALTPLLPTWSMPPVPPDRQELPLILTDIDGCITHIAEKTGVNPFVVDRLNQWSRNRTAEVRWMTYRGHRAATEFAPAVGLDIFEHGRDVYFEEPNLEVQVLRWIDRNPERPIVWVDDEIHNYLRSFGNNNASNRPLVDRMLQHRNLLLVQPNAKQGLTTDELQMIDTFLAGGMQAEEVLAQNSRVVPGET